MEREREGEYREGERISEYNRTNVMPRPPRGGRSLSLWTGHRYEVRFQQCRSSDGSSTLRLSSFSALMDCNGGITGIGRERTPQWMTLHFLNLGLGVLMVFLVIDCVSSSNERRRHAGRRERISSTLQSTHLMDP